jgi:hypothetical protein
MSNGDVGPVSFTPQPQHTRISGSAALHAMTALSNGLYISFQANDPGHALFVTSSTDGVNSTTPATGYPGILTGSAPATGKFGQNLFVAFQANNPGHVLYVTASSPVGNAQ